jgi:predicted permease
MGLIRRLRNTLLSENTIVEEEVRFHLERRIADLIERGVPPGEARQEALRRFGGVLAARARTRDADVIGWLDGLVHDVRHAARSLWRAPGLVATSVLSLGLGIGVNLALYSGVSTIFLHQPTMTAPDRVVGVQPGGAWQVSYPNFSDLRDSGIFADAMGFRTASLNRGTLDDLERVSALVVSANFFEGLGVRARLGRTFAAAEAAPAQAPRAVVLSHRYWQGRFGADRGVIGQTMTLNGEPFEVIGVLGADFRAITGFVEPSIYVPISKLTLPTLDDRGSVALTVMARLRDDSTADRMPQAVTAWGQSLERSYPDRNEGLGRPAVIFPARSLQFRGTPAGFVLFPIVLAVLFSILLLLGSVNVAGLLLARATSRRKELAIRTALGAGRWRVVQSLLVESLILSTLGTAAGLLLNVLLTRLPGSAANGFLQQMMVPDAGLVGPAVLLILVTTVLCGAVPALRATRGHVLERLRQEEATHSGRLPIRHALVVSQVAMSLVLLVVASLCLRSQMRVFAVNPGFDLDHGVVARITLEPRRDTPEGRAAVAERLVERLEGLAGLRTAAATSIVPLGGDALVASFHPAGRSDIPGTRPTSVSVGPRYFATLGTPLLGGREFEETDRSGAPVVAIVNRTFANTYFPGGTAIGQPIEMGGEPRAEIVGVVADSKMDTIGEAPKSVIYYPFAQRPRRVTVLMRSDGPPSAMVRPVDKAISELDPTLAASVSTLRDAAGTELAMRQTGTVMVGAIGIVGLLLTTVGLYGVVAYLVASRTVEMGIRLALGASPQGLHWKVTQSAASLVAIGIAIGTGLSMMLTPALATFLAGLSPLDPIAYGAGAVALILVGLIASYVPARAVTRVDPTIALRQ